MNVWTQSILQIVCCPRIRLSNELMQGACVGPKQMKVRFANVSGNENNGVCVCVGGWGVAAGHVAPIGRDPLAVSVKA